jgi:hypothetical protein
VCGFVYVSRGWENLRFERSLYMLNRLTPHQKLTTLIRVPYIILAPHHFEKCTMSPGVISRRRQLHPDKTASRVNLLVLLSRTFTQSCEIRELVDLEIHRYLAFLTVLRISWSSDMLSFPPVAWPITCRADVSNSSVVQRRGEEQSLRNIRSRVPCLWRIYFELVSSLSWQPLRLEPEIYTLSREKAVTQCGIWCRTCRWRGCINIDSRSFGNMDDSSPPTTQTPRLE